MTKPGHLLPEYPGPHGYAAALEGLGSTAAPLLAGFAFALVGFTLDKNRVIWCANLSLVLLVAAGLLLIFAVQLTFVARRNFVSPSEYLAAQQVASADGFDATEVRAWQRDWLAQYKGWIRWVRAAYNFGTILFLLAIASVLIPASGPENMPPLRVVAFALILLAVFAYICLLMHYEEIEDRFRAR